MSDFSLELNSDFTFEPVNISVPVPESSLTHPADPPNKIVSVSSNDSRFDKYVSFSNSSVTIRGPIIDIFDKSIDYLVNGIIKTETQFENIHGADAILTYRAPASQIETIILTVDFLYEDPSYLIEVFIRYNYTSANANLAAMVKRGRF